MRHGDGDPDDDSYRLAGTPSALRDRRRPARPAPCAAIYDLAAAVRDGRVGHRAPRRPRSRRGCRSAWSTSAPPGSTPTRPSGRPATTTRTPRRPSPTCSLPDAPYVDPAGPRRRRTTTSTTYVRHSLASGYNAIAFPGFLEYLTFDDVPDGTRRTPTTTTSPARRRSHARGVRPDLGAGRRPRHEGVPAHRHARADAPRSSSYLDGPVRLARHRRTPSCGTSTPPGSTSSTPQMPDLDGVLIRIGEAGRVYDLDGWDYYSALAVTTVDRRAGDARRAHRAGRAGRPEVDLPHLERRASAPSATCTPTERRTRRCSAASTRPHLIVSTKYTLGDFYSQLPLNDTLEHRAQRRIIEFQSRREFENFGAFPNDLGALYQQALQRFSPRTRTSRASGPGRRTAAPGAPGR